MEENTEGLYVNRYGELCVMWGWAEYQVQVLDMYDNKIFVGATRR